MLDDQEIRRRIKNLIVDRLFLEKVSAESIEDDKALFGEGLGLDSVDALELVLGIEEEFDIKIKKKAIPRESFANVATLAEYVGARLSKGSALGG